MINTSVISLEGSHEQVKELHRAIEIAKTVLFQMGGEDSGMDKAIEGRLSKLNYWQESILLKLEKVP